jgi:hypothetical protein
MTTISRKNLRYCQVTYLSRLYDVLVAVATLDEVDNVLQEWALNKWGVTLDLPAACLVNKDITEVLTSVVIDSYAYLKSPSSSYMEIPRYAGIKGTYPTLPTALDDDDKYVCPETDVFIYSLAGQDGVLGEYSVAELALTPNVGINFLGISYASAVPVWVFYTAETSIDYSSIIPVATVLYFESTVFNIPFGQTGYGLAEKNLKVRNRRKKFEILDTYTLANSGLYVELSALTVSTGVEEIDCLAMDTETLLNDMYLYYKDSSQVWQKSKVTTLDNAQYQSASGLDNLAGGEFVINNIYRVVSEDGLLMFNVLSNKFATAQLAMNNGEVEIPAIIRDSAVCVGRFIIEQGSSSPVVQKVQKVVFGG